MTGKPNQCGGTSRTGKPCGHPAGFGTDHGGFGNCKFHGGSTPDGVKHAARLQAENFAAEQALVGHVEMDPHEAILDSLHRQIKIVVYYGIRVSMLQQSELLVERRRERTSLSDDGAGSYVERSNDSQLHMWARLYSQAVLEQSKLAKTTLDAGVQERQVRIAEQFGEELARLLDGVLGDLELDERQLQLAPNVVRKHLVVLEGGAQAA